MPTTRADDVRGTGSDACTTRALETRDAERADAERLQDALYRIAEAASAAQDLHAFYATIHGIVGELMDARNFYIALYDDERRAINFPYYVDNVDRTSPIRDAWEPFGIGNARGLTGVRPANRRAGPSDHARALAGARRGAARSRLIGEAGEDWLGVPLLADGQRHRHRRRPDLRRPASITASRTSTSSRSSASTSRPR